MPDEIIKIELEISEKDVMTLMAGVATAAVLSKLKKQIIDLYKAQFTGERYITVKNTDYSKHYISVKDRFAPSSGIVATLYKDLPGYEEIAKSLCELMNSQTEEENIALTTKATTTNA